MADNTSLRTLALAVGENNRNLPVPAEVYRAAPQAYSLEAEPEEAMLPLSHYFWILRRQWWKILAFIVFCVGAAAIVSQRITPVYESTATIDVDRQLPPGVVGQEALRATTNDADQFLATQVKLIQSDSVLRPVTDRFQLREIDGAGPANASSAGQAAAADAPVQLKSLKVTRPPNTYLLLVSFRSTEPRLAADVANAVAASYLEHTFNIRIRSSASLSSFMERQLEELKAKMERSGSALMQFERELNVINPEEKTSILSARLLQLNTEFTNAQTDRVRKEAAYRSVRSGSMEAAQVSTQGEALKRLNERLDDAAQKFAEVRNLYGTSHPEYKKAATQYAEIQRQLLRTKENIGQRVEVEYAQSSNREEMLSKAVAETKMEFDRLNARSFEYQALKREAEADKKIYEELVRKIKEAGINAGFQNSSIRIADTARAAIRPVFPNLPLNLTLAFLLSSILGIGAAVLGDMLNNTVRDPEQIARTTHTEVVGSLPIVKNWRNGLIPSGSSSDTALVPAAAATEQAMTGFEEAIRTLRNSILLADFDRRLRSILITSASPSEGKSTVAAHLALAHSQQGKKTLLIDADLRRPSQHRRFNVSGGRTGLSNVLTSETPWQEAVMTSEASANLHFLLAGPPSRRAADMVGAGLSVLLEEAGRDYDLVIVDSPPLLGFPEPLQMAAAVDGVLVVALAGQTHRKALASAIATLSRLRANVVGVVLNSLSADAGAGYYYHYYHSKYYQAYASSSRPD